MRLHADLDQPALVDSAALPWIPSPAPGVARRLLDRDGAEVARATSLVRYDPGSAFAPHAHDQGEEFLVLEGVFSDETGDFPAGWYVRNPPGSRHRPASGPGATILVKLRQMPPQDHTVLRCDTNDPALWQTIAPSLTEALLFAAPWERVVMRRLGPGAVLADTVYPRGIEFFVVSGRVDANHNRLGPGGWLRLPAGSALTLTSAEGALLWMKTGHLG